MNAIPTENPHFSVHLVNDFDTFIDYIDSNTIVLTKTKGYIGRKHLPLIDEQRTTEIRSDQGSKGRCTGAIFL